MANFQEAVRVECQLVSLLLCCSEVWLAFHVLLLCIVAVLRNIFKKATSYHYVPDGFGGHLRTLGRYAKRFSVGAFWV